MSTQVMVEAPTLGVRIWRRLWRGTVSNLAGRLVILAAGFVLTPFVLHRLGPTDYGLWVLVNSVASYGSLLDLGIAGAVTKYVAEYRAQNDLRQARTLIATAWVLYLAMGVLVVLVGLGFALLFPSFFSVPDDSRATARELLVIASVSVGLSLPYALTAAILRGVHRFDLINLIASLASALSVLGTITVLLAGWGVVAVMSVAVPVMLFSLCMGMLCVRRSAPDLTIGWRGARRHMVGTIASFGSSLFVMDIAGRLQSSSDELAIGAFLPITLLTPYSLAKRLSGIAQTLADQFMKVLLPLASELNAQQDRSQLRTLYLTSSRLSLALFVPIGLTIVLLAQPILTLWIGPDFAEASPLVALLMAASLAATSQWPAGAFLQAMARHRFLAASSLLAGITTAGLAALLAVPFGLTGVAVGVLVPTMAECLLLVFPYTLHVLSLTLSDYVRAVLAPTLLPAVPMALVLTLALWTIGCGTWTSLFTTAIVAGLVYAFAYTCWSPSEIERRFWTTCIRTTMQSVHLRA